MIKKAVKSDLMLKESILKNNLSNNYKDAAHEALADFDKAVEEYHDSGQLKDKDYEGIIALKERKKGCRTDGYHWTTSDRK